jgi:hypothetical protein
MKTKLYIKTGISIGLAFLIVHLVFNNINSPREMAIAVNDMVYHNSLLNKSLANSSLYDKLVHSMMAGKVEAEEREVNYKGMKLKIYTRKDEVSNEFLEAVYQDKLKEQGQPVPSQGGSHLEFK